MGNVGKNSQLHKAKKEKNDEFYTQYHDIEKEMNAYLEYDANTFRGKTVLLPCNDPEWSNFTKYFAQNFTRLGLKKLISTGYAIGGRGKIFTVDVDINGDGVIDIDDLKWEYLEGSGDFRSDEVKKLRSEADIIVTNPPFSLFREFMDWIFEGNKKCVIMGNMNAIICKNIFPLIQENKLWLGSGKDNGNKEFRVPDSYELYANDFRISEGGTKYIGVKGVKWFTNLEHGRRHQPMQLMTMADNKKFNKKVIKTPEIYQKYDNYDAIEISYTEAIPSDYEGIMGVPISFLDKYCPEQFEILGISQRGCHDLVPDTRKYNDYIEVRQNGEKTGSSGVKTNENANLAINDGKKNYFINKDGHIVQSLYSRIFIRHKK